MHLLRLLKEMNNVELSRISSHKTVIEFDDNKKGKQAPAVMPHALSILLCPLKYVCKLSKVCE